MHPVVAKLLLSKLAAPVILAGSLALAAGGAAALSHDRGNHRHHGCGEPRAQTTQSSVGYAVSWTCSDRDGDGD
jgi:hypothetical protein